MHTYVFLVMWREVDHGALQRHYYVLLAPGDGVSSDYAVFRLALATLMPLIMERFPDVKHRIYISDGSPGQLRTRYAMIGIGQIMWYYDVEITYVFKAPYHGACLCDAFISLVNVTIENMQRLREFGNADFGFFCVVVLRMFRFVVALLCFLFFVNSC